MYWIQNMNSFSLITWVNEYIYIYIYIYIHIVRNNVNYFTLWIDRCIVFILWFDASDDHSVICIVGMLIISSGIHWAAERVLALQKLHSIVSIKPGAQGPSCFPEFPGWSSDSRRPKLLHRILLTLPQVPQRPFSGSSMPG